MAINFDAYNQKATQWKDDIVKLSKSTARSMGVQHRSNSPSANDSVNKIRGRVGLKDGLVERVTITFDRSLIWPQKGAGKGMGGSKGSRWVDKYGNQKKTDPKSFGKMDTGNRKAKPFFNTALDGDQGVNQLATIAAEEIGSSITHNLFVK